MILKRFAALQAEEPVRYQRETLDQLQSASPSMEAVNVTGIGW
jgi:hypothetical protein